jgi:hypothetical protein
VGDRREEGRRERGVRGWVCERERGVRGLRAEGRGGVNDKSWLGMPCREMITIFRRSL